MSASPLHRLRSAALLSVALLAPLAADVEDRARIAPANTPFDKKSGLLDDRTLTFTPT